MIPESIVVDGTRQGARFLIRVDQHPIKLQPIPFLFFAIFGIQFVLGEDDGWVSGTAIYDPPRLVVAYIHRLKQNVHNVSDRLQSWKVVENDRQGKYRLIARPGSVTVNTDNLYEFGDHSLVLMVDKLVGTKDSVAR